MTISHEPLRYAHDEGHTDVCYSSDGSKFVTCGADGDIRIWSTDESEDPVHKCVGEWALSVRQNGDSLYVATGSNDIQILSFPEGERSSVWDRFVAPINHITVSKDGEYVALAGEDMEAKLLKLGTEKDVKVFDGLGGPCLSVALNPEVNILAASSGDGKLRIWNLETKAVLKDIDCFPKINSFANAKILCRIDFEPKSGSLLAYPTKNSIVLLNSFNWSEDSTLKCDEVSADLSLVQFSPCGRFIAATSIEGDIVVFKVSSGMVYATSKHPNSTSICSFMWNPTGNGEIAYTDVEGQLGIMSGCSSVQKNTEIDDGIEENEVDFGEIQFEDDDDEDNENAVSVEKLKRDIMGDSEPELNFDARSSIAPTPRPRTPEIPQQGAFMPSSTPEHLNPRYLCWNAVAVIRSYSSSQEEDSEKSLEVEFHDTSFHNSMMLQNYQEYTMGSISNSALAIANTNELHVIPLNASSKEWLLKMDDPSQEIVLVSSSEKLICVATSNYFVRICSIFGTQRGILSVPGPIVSMASHQEMLLVAYHLGGVRKGDQCIGIKLIRFKKLSMESYELGSALAPECTLFWLGFSDVGTPAMMDSSGMLSLYPKTCNIWVPFCDTSKLSKSPSDGFFITSVMESYQTITGIKCKGSVYPGFTPRPTICEVPLMPPFAELETEKTQMELELFALSNLQVSEMDKKFREKALKVFALACRNNLDQRAMEFMEIVGNSHLVSLSTKYAMKLNKKNLAEKLMELASQLMNEDEDNEETSYISSVGTPEPSTMKSFTSKKLSLSSFKRNKSKPLPEVLKTPEIGISSSLSLNNTLDESTISIPEVLPPEGPKNPFLKSLKKAEPLNPNPLSLTDKFAGVEFSDSKENKSIASAEKRKQPDSETDKQRDKQRKLDRFMFAKRSQ